MASYIDPPNLVDSLTKDFQNVVKRWCERFLDANPHAKINTDLILQELVMPQIRELSNFLEKHSASLQGGYLEVGNRVIWVMKHLCEWSIEAKQTSLGKNIDKVTQYIFNNYEKLLGLVPLANKTIPFEKVTDPWFYSKITAPQIISEMSAPIPTMLTPKIVLDQFSKIYLISPDRGVSSSPERLMALPKYYKTATFRASISNPGALTYIAAKLEESEEVLYTFTEEELADVNIAIQTAWIKAREFRSLEIQNHNLKTSIKDGKIIGTKQKIVITKLLITEEKLRNMDLSDVYKQAFGNVESCFGTKYTHEECTPLEDIFYRSETEFRIQNSE